MHNNKIKGKYMLKNKKILIFVSGSIAIYKVLFLIRALRKEGALIRIVATKSALKFITPLSFETLSNTTLLHDNNESWVIDNVIDNKNLLHDPYNAPLNHIGYAKWANLALFAPASVNSINKLSQGIADNIYLSCAIALPHIPKLIAPSANTFMLNNQATKISIKTLKEHGYDIINPEYGSLACGDNGNGAMANTEEIMFRIKKALQENTYWKNKKVIITGGGSSEAIDSIRHISNNSSGLQACNLALALYYLGANVTLISSKLPLNLPNDINIINVVSSKDYHEAIIKNVDTNKTYLFMVAAISDYIPIKKDGKLKKKDLGDTMLLELYENTDILKSLEINNLVKIAFKAECDIENAKQNAINTLISKQCSMVCLNIITQYNKGFGSEKNELYLFTKDSEKYIKGTKFDISIMLCNHIQELNL